MMKLNYRFTTVVSLALLPIATFGVVLTSQTWGKKLIVRLSEKRWISDWLIAYLLYRFDDLHQLQAKRCSPHEWVQIFIDRPQALSVFRRRRANRDHYTEGRIPLARKPGSVVARNHR